MAFVCSGIVLSRSEVPTGQHAVWLNGGLAYLHSPASDAGSERGLDHLEWADGLARTVGGGARVVYVEAEGFGGTGSQAAIGWEGGVVSFGPLRTRTPTDDREGYLVVDGDEMAINAALRWLGVVREAPLDEFDTVGLGRCAIGN